MHEENCLCLAPDANLIRDVRVKNKSQTNCVRLLWRVHTIESTQLKNVIVFSLDKPLIIVKGTAL